MELKSSGPRAAEVADSRLGFHVTVRGASHVRQGAKCQDYSKTMRFDSSAAAAVADGHGDVRYFRSGVGSRFAVEAALAAIREFLLHEEGGSAPCVTEE